MISPRVDSPTMNSHPSARPQTSTSFATGIYKAAVMEPETMLMVVKREWFWNSLVAYGVRL
jgi:hypothetical protein